MNILDIIILICLIPALIQGIVKGFVSQAVSIIAIIVGVWASSHFAGIVCQWLSKFITASGQILEVSAFAIIFILVIIALILLGKLLEKIITLAMLGWLNKLLGAVFAVVKWTLILGLIAIAFNAINQTVHLVNPSIFEQSVLYPVLLKFSDMVFPYFNNLMTA